MDNLAARRARGARGRAGRGRRHEARTREYGRGRRARSGDGIRASSACVASWDCSSRWQHQGDGQGGDHARGRGARGAPFEPSKPFFPDPGLTKRDVADYYVAVADAATCHLRERPTTMKRFIDGAAGEFFFQKRVPKGAPDWLETATVHFPSGRSATELVANDAAHLVWAVNLGVIDFNPWPARRADLDHPDELRVDLDPTPEASFDDVRQVALCVREVLADHGPSRLSEDLGVARNPRQRPGRAAVGLHRGPPSGAGPGARGRAARAEARDVEVVEGGAPRSVRRLQPERPRPHGRLRLLGPPHARRPRLDARSSGTRSRTSTRPSCASTRCRRASPSAATPRETIDDLSFSLEPLLELADRDEAEGLGDAPWPPHFRKQTGEPKRVQPSRAKKS